MRQAHKGDKKYVVKETSYKSNSSVAEMPKKTFLLGTVRTEGDSFPVNCINFGPNQDFTYGGEVGRHLKTLPALS